MAVAKVEQEPTKGTGGGQSDFQSVRLEGVKAKTLLQVIGHRGDIQNFRGLGLALFAELAQAEVV